MINVSAEFKELMQSRTDFKQYAEITLADGTVWALDDTDFRITGNSVNDGVDANGLPLGVAAGRTVKLSIQNTEEQFKDVAFLGAEIRLYLTFQLSETVERVEFGVFTVISPEDYGETISVQAVDNAWKLDTPYTTTLQYPQTAGAVFRDICTRCSILAESSNFLNNDFVIESAPDSGLTNREMIGYIAMIAGGNARFNRSGKLEILTYEFPEFTIEDLDIYDGGSFEGWTTGDIVDGGDFTNWNSEDVIDGGSFNPWTTGDGIGGEIETDENTHVLRQWINLKPFTEDIVITGIQTTKTVTDSEGNETETPVVYGADGYVLSIDNPLIAGKEETALALIGDVLVGARIRNFEGDHIGYPLAEFMDKAVLVDRKGNVAPTVLTDINFNFFGITTMANSAAPPLRLSSKYNSAASQAIIAAKNLVAKEKTQRELAIEALNTALSNSSGLYLTEEKQSDDSIITYLHDKPSLAESQTVIKRTAAGIGISNNGGVTYEYGLFFTGDAVLNTLQAEGVNADWINTGTLTGTDSDGNVQFSFDVVTGNHWVNGDSVKINLGGTETNAQTQIAANANGVSQVTNRLNNNYSTTAQIQSMIDDSSASIELSVTQSVSEKIGGKNCLLDSGTERTHGYNSLSVMRFIYAEPPVAGQTYTLSFDARTSNGTDAFYVSIGNNASTVVRLIDTDDINVTSAYKRFSITVDSWPSASNDGIIFIHHKNHGAGFNANNTGTLYVQNVMLSAGSTAHEWNASTEDIKEVSARFGMYVGKDENNQIVSMLEAAANEINITGNRISIDSDKFTLTADGEIEATAGTIGGFTITDTKLYTDDHKNPAGNYVPGVVLDNKNGLISVGDGVFKSNASGQARIGTASYYVLFSEDSGYTYNVNVEGSTSFRDAVYFGDAVQFSEMPTFPSYIPVSEGGTGKGSFTNNAVLIGNGSSAIKAVSTYAGVLQCDYTGGLPYFAPLESSGGGGTIGGQTSITLSTSAVEKTVSLSGANSYYIVASPNINTGNPINWTVCSRTSTGFKIKCAPNSALNGTSVGFDWIAIPM